MLDLFDFTQLPIRLRVLGKLLEQGPVLRTERLERPLRVPHPIATPLSCFLRLGQQVVGVVQHHGDQGKCVCPQLHGTLPLDPELEWPSPAPGIHLVLRGSTPGVYYGVGWNGLNVQEGNDMLIYSWATELEAYEFSATVRGESEYACCFDYKLVWQHRLHQQHQELEDYASYTNPWAGLVHP